MLTVEGRLAVVHDGVPVPCSMPIKEAYPSGPQTVEHSGHASRWRADLPKVNRFPGIAKATMSQLTEKTLFTQFHAFIGTPAYTRPWRADGNEQASTLSMPAATSTARACSSTNCSRRAPSLDANELAQVGHWRQCAGPSARSIRRGPRIALTTPREGRAIRWLASASD